MRRIYCVILVLAVVLALSVSVSAANGVSGMQSFASVAADGSCQVSMTVTLHLEQTVDKLSFPIPGDATGVAVNGSRVSAPRNGQVRNINLSRIVGNMVGDFTVNIQYSLRDVIVMSEEGILQLQLPLLCGFNHPMEKLEFSITLPGEVPVRPSFSSGYHQAGIEEDLHCSVSGSVITVRSLRALKDQETLTMTMAVSDTMFPQSIVKTQTADTAYTAMLICAIVGAVYWLLFLRSLPWRRKRCSQPPEGYTAGQVGSLAYMQGVDLTMQVFTWAQLGYLQIIRDRKGYITLQKRMEMGNERSEAECRCFGKLFGAKTTVDTRSMRYATLLMAEEKRPTMVRELLHKRSGNAMLLRIVAAAIGVCAGGGIGLCLGSGAVLQVFLVILLAALCGVSGWYMVRWVIGWQLRGRYELYRAGILAAVWLLLGLLCGEGMLGVYLALAMIGFGILYAWSGRRTELGRQMTSQALGLKRHLRRPDKEQLQLQIQADPNCFFEMVPYAFGKEKFECCPYITGVDGARTALGWCAVLHAVAEEMDRRARNLLLERIMTLIGRQKNR